MTPRSLQEWVWSPALSHSALLRGFHSNLSLFCAAGQGKATLGQLLPPSPTQEQSQLQDQSLRGEQAVPGWFLLFPIHAVFLGYKQKQGMVNGWPCISCGNNRRIPGWQMGFSLCLVVPVNKTFANSPGQDIFWIFAYFWNFYDSLEESGTPSCGYSSSAAY